jgi:hypothetical protein
VNLGIARQYAVPDQNPRLLNAPPLTPAARDKGPGDRPPE